MKKYRTWARDFKANERRTRAGYSAYIAIFSWLLPGNLYLLVWLNTHFE